MKKSLVALVLAAVAVAGIGGSATASSQQRTGMNQKNVVQVAASNPQFSTLVSLVKKAGLAGALSKGSLTVFAPTNAAFAYLKAHDPATYKAATTNGAVLKKVLTYHVVGKKVPAAGRGRRGQGKRQGHDAGRREDRPLAGGRQDQAERQRHRRRPEHRGLERRHPRHQPRPRPTVPDEGSGADELDPRTRSRQPGLLDAGLTRTEGGARPGAFRRRAVHHLRADQRGVPEARNCSSRHLSGRARRPRTADEGTHLPRRRRCDQEHPGDHRRAEAGQRHVPRGRADRTLARRAGS